MGISTIEQARSPAHLELERVNDLRSYFVNNEGKLLETDDIRDYCNQFPAKQIGSDYVRHLIAEVNTTFGTHALRVYSILRDNHYVLMPQITEGEWTSIPDLSFNHPNPELQKVYELATRVTLSNGNNNMLRRYLTHGECVLFLNILRMSLQSAPRSQDIVIFPNTELLSIMYGDKGYYPPNDSTEKYTDLYRRMYKKFDQRLRTQICYLNENLQLLRDNNKGTIPLIEIASIERNVFDGRRTMLIDGQVLTPFSKN